MGSLRNFNCAFLLCIEVHMNAASYFGQKRQDVGRVKHSIVDLQWELFREV